MTILRWARRSALISLAVAAVMLPLAAGTAQASPIISVLGGNNIGVNASVSGNSVDTVPLSVAAWVNLTTDGLDVGMDGAGLTGDAALGLDVDASVDALVSAVLAVDVDAGVAMGLGG